MTNPIHISLPGGFTRTQRVIELTQQIRRMDKNVVISTYDTVQGLQWNGGRLILNQQVKNIQNVGIHRVLYDVSTHNLRTAVDRVKQLNDHGISFNLTFNNVLENLDTDDEDGNYLLEKLHADGNWVTVATRALTHHIRANYPKFKLTASICFDYHHLEQYVQACQIYDLVVIMPGFAYQPEQLAQLPLDKLSFIINDHCFMFCPRKEHYAALSRASLAGNASLAEQQFNLRIPPCFRQSVPGFAQKRPDGLDPKMMNAVIKKAFGQVSKNADALPGKKEYNITQATRKELLRLGVNHFKLQGRALSEERYEEDVASFLETFVQNEL